MYSSSFLCIFCFQYLNIICFLNKAYWPVKMTFAKQKWLHSLAATFSPNRKVRRASAAFEILFLSKLPLRGLYVSLVGRGNSFEICSVYLIFNMSSPTCFILSYLVFASFRDSRYHMFLTIKVCRRGQVGKRLRNSRVSRHWRHWRRRRRRRGRLRMLLNAFDLINKRWV